MVVPVREEIQRVLTRLLHRYPHEPPQVLRWQVDWLLCRLLNVERSRLYTQLHEPFPEHLRPNWENWIHRWMDGEPLAYILGSWGFWTMSDLKIEPGVFIPRPETETIVEAVIECYPERMCPLCIVDVGTGCGALAIALAREYPESRVFAVDISQKTLYLARENAQRYGVDDRITFLVSDLLSALKPVPVFDVIVSNPPYIPHKDFPSLPETVRNYEPYEALVPGVGFPQIYQHLAEQAQDRLRPGGYLICEIGAGQSEIVTRIFTGLKGTFKGIKKDLLGIPRTLIWKASNPE